MLKNHKKGFTLIELLVVVAIIGVLATIVLSSLSAARARARDAKRQADMNAIKTALEIYHIDNGFYPAMYRNSGDVAEWESFMTLLDTRLPSDPINEPEGANIGVTNLNYRYLSANNAAYCNRQAYILVYTKEGSVDLGDSVTFCDNSSTGFGNNTTIGVGFN